MGNGGNGLYSAGITLKTPFIRRHWPGQVQMNT
jgi:hypothetical protein